MRLKREAVYEKYQSARMQRVTFQFMTFEKQRECFMKNPGLKKLLDFDNKIGHAYTRFYFRL